ncbi:hypothetical protein YC2023_122285 [Brassica napus]
MSLWTLVPRLIFGDYPEEDDDREDEDADASDNDHCCSQFVYGTLLLHKAPVLERFQGKGLKIDENKHAALVIFATALRSQQSFCDLWIFEVSVWNSSARCGL